MKFIDSYDLKLFSGENLEISARIRYRQTLQKPHYIKQKGNKEVLKASISNNVRTICCLVSWKRAIKSGNTFTKNTYRVKTLVAVTGEQLSKLKREASLLNNYVEVNCF